jgi:TRAP-type uncharacterized transport system substrate-binding protein
MKGLAGAVVAVALVTASSDAQGPPQPLPRTELILLTGFESGTYYPVGRDIRRLLDERAPQLGIELAVVPSRGALQNVVDVFRHPAIQLGITQADVLSYLEIYARGDPEARRILGGLQVVSPLFDEDVYLFARPEYKEIGDLAGKRIAIGPAGSGTTVTALVPSTIPAGTYPWLERAVDTVKVTSLLVTAGAPPGSPACDAIGQLATLVTKNLDWLKRHGQPAWKDVRHAPAAILADPRLSPCVTKPFRQ